MSVVPHPLARPELSQLSPPVIHSRYRSGVTERLYTNHHGGAYASYPCPLPRSLQETFAVSIERLERPRLRHPGATRLDASHVLMTAGTIMGIDLLIRAFCDPRTDSICITSPTFPPYAAIATSLGVRVTDVPLQGEALDDIDVDAIVAADAKLTFFCSPNNPTSTALDPEAILAVVQRVRGLVVVDEAYIEFSRRYSLADVAASYENLVVLRTLSKAWGLAGVRTGTMIAQPSVLDTIRLVQDPFACSTPAQVEAERRLLDLDVVRAAIDRSIAERDELAAALSAVPSVRRVLPSETNFLFCQLRDSGAVTTLLGRHPDLLAADMSSQRAGCIKISLGTASENRALVRALGQR